MTRAGDPRRWTTPGAYNMPSETAKAYSARGTAAKQRLRTLSIEGEVVTSDDIAERTGVTRGTVERRMAHLRRTLAPEEPITWALLGRKGGG